MATCRECKRSVPGKDAEAISFVCECGHRWLIPKGKKEIKNNLAISNK